MNSLKGDDQHSREPAPGASGPEHRQEKTRWWANPRVLEPVIVFLAGVAVMQYIYAGTGGPAGSERGVPGHDSFYHVKMAAMMPVHGLLREFPWLRFAYFTEEGQAFISHHYGFHLLLAPFVHLSHWLTGDYLPGARWAVTTFFALALLLFDRILIAGQVRWRLIWLLLFMVMPTQFFSRHAYIRAISPSLACMLLIVLLAFRRRYFWTAVVIAAYIHLYLGGVLYAPFLIGLYTLASVVGPKGDREVPWGLIAWSTAGWLAGVATHPYLGGMLEFLKLQVFGSGLSPDIPVGREWKPYKDVWWFAQMCGPVLLAWAAAVCLRFRLGRALDARELFLLLANFAFLVLTFKARRFIEYWPVFCLLSAAFLAAPLISPLAESFDRAFRREGRGLRWRWFGVPAVLVIAALIISAATIAGGANQWRAIQRTARCGYDLAAVSEAMAFLKDHSKPGDVVFTDDWDIFPIYFYYNSHNHYIVGLDPKFTHARRPDLWKRYVKVSRGQVPSNVTFQTLDDSGKEVTRELKVGLNDIRDHFGTKFVITDSDHGSLASKLAHARSFAELIYPTTTYSDSRDAPYLIFRIIDPEQTDEEQN